MTINSISAGKGKEYLQQGCENCIIDYIIEKNS